MNTFIFFLDPIIFNSIENKSHKPIDFVIPHQIKPNKGDNIFIYQVGDEYSGREVKFKVEAVLNEGITPSSGCVTIARIEKIAE